MDTYVEIGPNATSYVGHDAVDLYRARMLTSALGFYIKTGLIPTRGMTITKMLRLASQYTGRTYKRGQNAIAYEDMRCWTNNFALSLPHIGGDNV